MEYEITLKDLREYLSQFGPEEIVGTAGDSDSCLVARCLNQKYKSYHGFIVLNKSFTTHNLYEPWHALPGEVALVVSKFDKLGGEDVTRKDVEEGIPQLRQGEQDA